MWPESFESHNFMYCCGGSSGGGGGKGWLAEWFLSFLGLRMILSAVAYAATYLTLMLCYKYSIVQCCTLRVDKPISDFMGHSGTGRDIVVCYVRCNSHVQVHRANKPLVLGIMFDVIVQLQYNTHLGNVSLSIQYPKLRPTTHPTTSELPFFQSLRPIGVCLL